MKLLGAILLGLGILGLNGNPLEGGGKDGDSIIKVEARGKLKTGVVAIGGETTGIILVTKDGKLELDLGKQELKDQAEKLSGKVVVVTGNLSIRKGVETGQRLIVNVGTLKAAE